MFYRLSFENFKVWMEKHSLLLDVFNNTFHEGIWGAKKSGEIIINEVNEGKEEKGIQEPEEEKNVEFQTSAQASESSEEKKEKDEKSKGKKKEKQSKEQKKEAKKIAELEKKQTKEKKKEEKNPKLGFQLQYIFHIKKKFLSFLDNLIKLDFFTKKKVL